MPSFYLLAVVKTAHLKKYGFDEVLKPLLDDLRKLASSDGYFFVVDSRPIPLRGGCLCILW